MLGSKSSTGLDQNIAVFLCYLFGWISGLILLLVEKKNRTVHFHAAQSIVLFGVLTLCSIVAPAIPAIGGVLQGLIGILSLGLWIVLMVTALMDKPPRLPIAEEFADKLVNQVV